MSDEADDPEPTEMPAAPQSAADVLYGTLARLPVEPVRIAGSLILRKRHGIVVKEVPYAIELRWGESPAKATYRLFDGFGRPLRTLEIARFADGGTKTFFLAHLSRENNRPELALTSALKATVGMNVRIEVLPVYGEKLIEIG